MEDTLRVIRILAMIPTLCVVLILVLMEDTLRVVNIYPSFFNKSLNPCFNGRYSQSYNQNGKETSY